MPPSVRTVGSHEPVGEPPSYFPAGSAFVMSDPPAASMTENPPQVSRTRSPSKISLSTTRKEPGGLLSTFTSVVDVDTGRPRPMPVRLTWTAFWGMLLGCLLLHEGVQEECGPGLRTQSRIATLLPISTHEPAISYSQIHRLVVPKQDRRRRSYSGGAHGTARGRWATVPVGCPLTTYEDRPPRGCSSESAGRNADSRGYRHAFPHFSDQRLSHGWTTNAALLPSQRLRSLRPARSRRVPPGAPCGVGSDNAIAI